MPQSDSSMPASAEELRLLQYNLLMPETTEEQGPGTLGNVLLLLNCILLSIGTSCGPLIMRLYYIHGGKRIWLSSFLETAAFPVILIPLAVSYIRRRRRSLADQTTKPKLVSMKLPLFLASAVIGFITGFDNYLYAYGIAWLPLSTSSLIIAAQLAFTAVFAYLLVRQKFTSYSINAVVLLTIGAVVLALHSKGDRPKGETSKQYAIGFAITVAAALMYGFILPLVELMYKKIKQPITYSLVMEVQLVVCVVATLFCMVGMIINNDFKVIPREAREFELGEVTYYAVLLCSAIIWQTFFLGAIGVIFCASSLMSGVIISVFLPITEVLAVVFYKESFPAEKGVALALSLWGFASYIYGERRQAKKKKSLSNRARESSQTVA